LTAPERCGTLLSDNNESLIIKEIIMDDNEHEELMNYLESLEALEEADKELQETLGYILDITN
jgi:hypothetical protein|tara:strand:+ start:655 stop:843 length:189 start_codon:yes stop_codon:yes gene_type:complete